MKKREWAYTEVNPSFNEHLSDCDLTPEPPGGDGWDLRGVIHTGGVRYFWQRDVEVNDEPE